jgi:hypothetical protein
MLEVDAMEIHPLCQTFPEMSTEEYKALSADIANHGLLEPIWTHQGQIIDGRHRYRAACELKIVPEYREWNGEGGSLLAVMVSKNLHRRHLDASQRAAIAAEVKPKIEAEIREQLKSKAKAIGPRGGRGRKKGLDENVKTLSEPRRNARAEAAAMLDVAPSYVSEAERIKEASPETFGEMKAGKVSISEARRKVGRGGGKGGAGHPARDRTPRASSDDRRDRGTAADGPPGDDGKIARSTIRGGPLKPGRPIIGELTLFEGAGPVVQQSVRARIGCGHGQELLLGGGRSGSSSFSPHACRSLFARPMGKSSSARST